MIKNYFFVFVAVLCSELALAQALATAPTLTFTNNTGVSSDNIATDGDGGSVNITDIDIQIYNISNVNGTFVTPLSWENASFYGISYTGLTANIATGTKGMAIKSVSGAEFKLNQFDYLNWGETSTATNTVKGFKNGVEVASTTFEGYSPIFTQATISLSNAFSDVDEVRFYISAGGYVGNQSYTNHSINSIKVSTAVLGLNDLELNSRIKIYPNPVSDNVTIEYEDLDNAKLEVYDITGKMVINQNLDSLTNLINIEKLPVGVYLFEVNSDQGVKITKMIKH